MPPAPSPSSPPAAGPDRAFWLLLGAAAALRAVEALRTPLWFDEIYSLRLAQASWSGLWALLAQDIHPPLHALLVWGWVHSLGDGMPWLRLLPLIAGTLTVGVAYAFAREAFGRPTAWLAAAFLALHPHHVYISQELRSFALLTLLLLTATWMAWRWVVGGRARDGALYVLTATAALYTHYLAGLALAAIGAWGLVILRRAPRRAGAWVGFNAAVLALFAPQAPAFLAQLRLQEDHWARRPDAAALLNLIRKQAFGNLKLVPVATALWFLAWRPPGPRTATALLWLLGPLMTLSAWSLARVGPQVFTERYLTFALPATMMLCAAGVTALPWRPVAWATALGLLAVEGRSLALHRPHEEAVALARVARAISARLHSGDIVYAGDTHSYLTLQHHLGPGVAVRLVLRDGGLPYYEGSAVIPDTSRVPPAAVEQAAGSGRGWWGVRMRTGGIPSEWTVPLFDSLAAGAVRYGPVTMWYGRPGMRPSQGGPATPGSPPSR